jgi:glycosyltransferase involved in cell wall biosynthesis
LPERLSPRIRPRRIDFVKILLSTFACGPNSISETSTGWRAVTHALSRGHEVWAAIHGHAFGKHVSDYLEKNPIPHFHPVYITLAPSLVRHFWKGTVRRNFYYTLWQQKLLEVARELHQEVGWDLCHHVTFGRCWSPSGLRGLDIPFVWGPVGAVERAPASFVAEFPLRDQLSEWIRDGVRRVAFFDPALKSTARAATIAIGTTRESAQALRNMGVRQVEQVPQVAVSDADLDRYGRMDLPPAGSPFRALCMGRLIHWKGFHLATRAFALFAKTHPDAELWIASYGHGPFRGEIEKIIVETGLQQQVKFFTDLPQDELMARLAQSHVLLHPALHDNFPAVPLEAMAAGRPVVCLDIAGPAAQVTAETGLVVPATNPDEAVAKMASFLAVLEGDRALLETLSKNARVRVREHFSLRALGEAFDSLYARAVALHAEEKAGRLPV